MKVNHLAEKILFYLKSTGQKVKFVPGVYYYDNGKFKLKTESGEELIMNAKTLKEDLCQQINDGDVLDSFLERIKRWKL